MMKRTILFFLTALIFCFLTYTFASSSEHASETEAPKPVATIDAAPFFGKAPLTVSFDASNFLYHFGKELSFLWDFDDGSRSTGVSNKHVFNSCGTYIVALTVNTPFGSKDAWVIIIVN
jgi:PKD repeat protein